MTEPTALVLVDGSNLAAQLRRRGDGVDVSALRGWAAAYGTPQVHWFQGAYEHAGAFLNVVRGAGIQVHTRVPKLLPNGRLKANCDTDLAVYGAKQLLGASVDTLVLVSGDGDFEPLLALAHERGARVVVVSDWGALDPALAQFAEPSDVVPIGDLPMRPPVLVEAA